MTEDPSMERFERELSRVMDERGMVTMDFSVREIAEAACLALKRCVETPDDGEVGT